MEKVEKKHEKSESHAKWNALMWGDESENGRNSVALCSASTAIENFLGSIVGGNEDTSLKCMGYVFIVW